MQIDYHRDFTNLHRMIGMVSGDTKFTAASRYYLLSTVMFPDFIYSCIRSYEINKTNKLATKINSTELYKGYGSQNFTRTYKWPNHAPEK